MEVSLELTIEVVRSVLELFLFFRSFFLDGCMEGRPETDDRSDTEP